MPQQRSLRALAGIAAALTIALPALSRAEETAQAPCPCTATAAPGESVDLKHIDLRAVPRQSNDVETASNGKGWKTGLIVGGAITGAVLTVAAGLALGYAVGATQFRNAGHSTLYI